MEKILIPTDFSSASNNAIKYGVELAEIYDSKITLFNSYHALPHNPEIYDFVRDNELEAIRQNSYEQLRQMSELINIRLKTPSIFECALGLATDEVLVIEKQTSPDLIVVGSHGASEFEHAIIGGTTLSLAKNVHSPLLIVPEKSTFKKINKILFTTDYHDSDVESIQFITEFASHFGAQVIVAHVSDGAALKLYSTASIKEFETSIREKVKYKNLTFVLINNENIEHGINNFVDDNGVQLMVISKTQRSFFSRLLMPSITNKMVYHTHIPLLVLRAWDKNRQ